MTEQIEIELALDARANLGEGPVWDDRTNELVWVNINAHEVHRFDPATGEDRFVTVGQPIGVASLREGDGLVLAVRDGFALMAEDGSLTFVADTEAHLPANRMNDGKPDRAGRFFAGTMEVDLRPGVAAFYRLDPDYSVTTMVTGLSLSNGIGWSPDDAAMYLIDSLDRVMFVFDYDLDTGTMRNRRALIEFPEEHGLPDGMAVDADGYLWVAMYAGAAIRRYAPDGSPDLVLDLPVSQPTCVAFAGPDLGDLYVTTASQLKSEEELAKEPTLGGLFHCRPGVKGLPANRFAG